MSDTIRNTFISLHEQDLIGELREQFLQQYGDHGIPVSNAKLIESAIEKKKSKRLADKKKGEDSLDSPVLGQKVKMDDMFTADPDAELDVAENEKEVEEAETDVILSASELADLGGSNYNGDDQVMVNGVKFIKLRALLPPAPPRGQFDVKRIRDSAYFFS